MNEKEKLELLDYYVKAARDAMGVYEESVNSDAKRLAWAELQGLCAQMAEKISNWRG